MPIALCKKATGNDLFVYKACACRLVATAIRDCHGQRHICKRVLSHRLRLEFVALTGPATSDMGTEHAVGESVVVPGLKLIDHTFQVPLDHDNKQSNTINLFVREVTALNKIGHKLPTLLFLQG